MALMYQIGGGASHYGISGRNRPAGGNPFGLGVPSSPSISRKDRESLQKGIEQRKPDTGSMLMSASAQQHWSWCAIRMRAAALTLRRACSMSLPYRLIRRALTSWRRNVNGLSSNASATCSPTWDKEEIAASLERHLQNGVNAPRVEREPREANVIASSDERERSSRWPVIVRRPIEVDEQ